MAEKNEGEQVAEDLETGNTKAGSSSVNSEIIKESPSTNVPPPTSVNKENTSPKDKNSDSDGGTGKDKGSPATSTTSKTCGCLVVLLVVLGLIVLLFAPVYYPIKFAFQIAAPKKPTIWVKLEWVALVGFIGFLIASLTKHNLKNHFIWELELWKWCILLMLVVCGKLISEWIVNAVFLLIRWLFADNLKVSCFAYGLKQKNRVSVWWGLVLIAWLALVVWFGNEGGTRSEETKTILDYVTRALASLVIGACLWLGKDLLLWSFAHSFQSKNFFESILEAMFYKFVIETLVDSSPGSVRERLIRRCGFFNWAEEIKKGRKSVVSIKLFIHSISHDSNYKLKPELNFCEEADAVRADEKNKDAKRDIEILNKDADCVTKIWERVLIRKSKREEDASDSKTEDRIENAKRVGEGVLNSVIKGSKSKETTDKKVGRSQRIDREIGSRREDPTITKNDIISLMTDEEPFFAKRKIKDEVDKLFQLIEIKLTKGDQSHDSIKGEDFRKWLGIVYQECDSLEHSLQSTRRGMEELNKLAKGIVLVLIVIVWLLMMKVLSTQAVALLLSQFFVLTFVFGDTCKRIFEGIVFAFVTHPFDIDDRCLIEGREEELFVKEINIQTTVFSRDPKGHQDDKEKIVYPNSVLATKHICNFHRIPTPPKLDMTDSVEFAVCASTSIKQIEALNSRLEADMKTNEWIKDISVRANGFENGDKIKMTVYITYDHLGTKNERNEWKSEIVLRLKQILEDMGISKYTPQVEPPSVPAV